MSELIEVLTGTTFEQSVLRSEVPYLVEYTSPSCAPCAALQPTLELIAREFAGEAKIGKVDIVTSPELAASQGVMSTPTMLVFVNGEPVTRLFGVRPKRHIVTELQEAVERRN